MTTCLVRSLFTESAVEGFEDGRLLCPHQSILGHVVAVSYVGVDEEGEFPVVSSAFGHGVERWASSPEAFSLWLVPLSWFAFNFAIHGDYSPGWNL